MLRRPAVEPPELADANMSTSNADGRLYNFYIKHNVQPCMSVLHLPLHKVVHKIRSIAYVNHRQVSDEVVVAATETEETRRIRTALVVSIFVDTMKYQYA